MQLLYILEDCTILISKQLHSGKGAKQILCLACHHQNRSLQPGILERKKRIKLVGIVAVIDQAQIKKVDPQYKGNGAKTIRVLDYHNNLTMCQNDIPIQPSEDRICLNM